GSGKGLLHSVWVNYQPRPVNTILGAEWTLAAGRREMWERPLSSGADICYLPGSFMQVMRPISQVHGEAPYTREKGSVCSWEQAACCPVQSFY
ncbi:hypothetical protein CYMTET_53248, partial [Cymbomonas tetramitiformis]